MNTPPVSNISLDFSDVVFNTLRGFHITELLAGHVVDAEALTSFEYHTTNGAKVIPGDAFLITSLSMKYDIDEMEMMYTIEFMNADGLTETYTMPKKQAWKISARCSMRMYGELPYEKRK